MATRQAVRTPAAPAEQKQPASAKAATLEGGRIVSLTM